MSETAKRLTTWDFVKSLRDRRVFVMLLLGAAAGLPFFLIFDTLSAWLRQSELSLQTIGVFALATLSYSLKFVWAPVVDRVKLPFLEPLLGQRRSWMALMQVLIVLGLWAIAGSSPALNLGQVALLAVMVGFCGATQDIAIDAWRIEVVDETFYGTMAAAYQWGYRVAMIVAGALPLVLADSFGWNFSYAVMSACMLIAVGATVLAPREKAQRPLVRLTDDIAAKPALEIAEWAGRLAFILLGALLAGSGLAANATFINAGLGLLGQSPESAEVFKAIWEARETGIFVQFPAVVVGLGLIALACVPLPGRPTRPSVYLRRAYGEPLAEFFGRFGLKFGLLIMALICMYRLSDFVLNLMNPFYIDLGFSLTQIAEVRKVYGVVASLAGIAAGAWLVSRLGIVRTMVIGVFASPLSNLIFIWLATQGASMPALYGAITIDNFATGVAGTALIVYMSSLTSAGFTATQYALFSSLYAIFGKILASQSGRIVEGSARMAEAGGFTAIFRPLFADLPEGALVKGAEIAEVTPVSLGAGYAAFFAYSVVIGAVAVVLAFIVARRQKEIEAKGAEAPAA
ncbi:permease [Brevundimonas sp. AAP58]|uniref:AmpG family muropeptide MFS transporter n=1 Tax=Brevundimonas sp. AAP58 TaxID=1523422 RepID=UPI0006B9B815|nr:MFS transporter [Brevundimonas sp. AAP58]KPF77674.1 permease [Brevundimonas sp. AAP58]